MRKEPATKRLSDQPAIPTIASSTRAVSCSSTATSVWAATAGELEGRGGIYLEDCHVAEPAQPGSEGGVEAYALDSSGADRLWSLSEQLVGQEFRF